jgi:hypothetical protein
MMPRAAALFLITILLSGLMTGGQENPNEAAKGYVRYSVRPEYTRLLVFFKGPLKYSQDLKENVLTLTVTDIKSAAAGGWRKQFRTGQIESAVVEPVAGGTSRIVIAMRNGFTKYQIVEHDRHEAIWVDVYSAQAAQPAVNVAAKVPPSQVKKTVPETMEVKKQPARITATKPQDKAAEQEQLSKSPIVDIAAIVRQQIEETSRQNSAAGSPVQAGASIQRSSIDRQPLSGGNKHIVWVALVSFSLLTSVVAMVVLIRRTRMRGRKLAQFLAARAAAQVPLAHSPAFEERPEIPNPVSEERGRGLVDVMEEEVASSLTFAERYHRSQGDIDLAMRLRESARTQSQAGAVKSLGTTPIPAKGRVSAAKKLGVGKGEFDLASKLLRLSIAQKEREEAA